MKGGCSIPSRAHGAGRASTRYQTLFYKGIPPAGLGKSSRHSEGWRARALQHLPTPPRVRGETSRNAKKGLSGKHWHVPGLMRFLGPEQCLHHRSITTHPVPASLISLHDGYLFLGGHRHHSREDTPSITPGCPSRPRPTASPRGSPSPSCTQGLTHSTGAMPLSVTGIIFRCLNVRQCL